MTFNPYMPITYTTTGTGGIYTDIYQSLTGRDEKFNLMLATSAISLGIRLDELKDFDVELTKQGVTGNTGYEKMYKGILSAAMKVIEKRGD